LQAGGGLALPITGDFEQEDYLCGLAGPNAHGGSRFLRQALKLFQKETLKISDILIA
jgi:hypothetical protein